MLQVSRGILACRRLVLRLGFFQAVPVPGDRFLYMLSEVVIQMPAIGDLDRVRRSLARAFGVGAGPVAADHLGPRVGAQPFLQRFRLAVAQ